MPVKGQWESRTGMILRCPESFAWAFKPADSPLYGGQARIDWLACDHKGRFWMVEVKQCALDRKTINVLTDVSPGQRDALTAIAQTEQGIALLAVGQENILYLFDWRTILWRLTQAGGFSERQRPLLPLSAAPIQVLWTGPKAWATNALNLYAQILWVNSREPSLPTEPTLIVPASLRTSVTPGKVLSKFRSNSS